MQTDVLEHCELKDAVEVVGIIRKNMAGLLVLMRAAYNRNDQLALARYTNTFMDADADLSGILEAMM